MAVAYKHVIYIFYLQSHIGNASIFSAILISSERSLLLLLIDFASFSTEVSFVPLNILLISSIILFYGGY